MATRKTTNGIPPKSKDETLTGEQLASSLQVLIGKDFALTGKPRTDGAKLRNLIEETLKGKDIELAEPNSYKIVPNKKKGIPKTLKYLAETFIVTTGNSYNLQVCNRVPNSRNILVKYNTGSTIRCNDINCILVKIDTNQMVIDCIIVASPKYIEQKFGKFGVPTIKFQAIINASTRCSIVSKPSRSLIVTDADHIKPLLTTKEKWMPQNSIANSPMQNQLLPIEEIARRTINKLIGERLGSTDTKSKGQELERKVANLLGYSGKDSLVGGYPDICNQALEVKVQDSPTIDLGKETPANPSVVFGNLSLTTEDIRYLIALTNPSTSIIEGIILVPGKELKNIFTMVNGTNFKCQRSIPMSLFEKNKGTSVFNPRG